VGSICESAFTLDADRCGDVLFRLARHSILPVNLRRRFTHRGPFSIYRSQARVIDGIADGRNLFGILSPRFTFRIISRRRERLQIMAYTQLGIAWLGESYSPVADLFPCRDRRLCKAAFHPLRAAQCALMSWPAEPY